MRSLLSHAIVAQHRWLGHVVRSPTSTCLASQALDWLNSEWWGFYKICNTTDDPGNKNHWRHETTNWQKRIETDMDTFYGKSWRNRAVDRWMWKGGERQLVEQWTRHYSSTTSNKPPTVGQHDNSALTIAEEPKHATLTSMRQETDRISPQIAKIPGKISSLKLYRDGSLAIPRLVIHGDNETVIQQMNGQAASRQEMIKLPSMHSYFHSLVVTYGVKPLDQFFCHHVPRRLNRKADALANRALDKGCTHTNGCRQD